MEIHEIKFEYAESRWEIRFVSKPIFRMYAGVGKTFPMTTQCVVSKNDLIIGLGTVTKHSKDENNFDYARKAAAKQAINNGNLRHWRELRTLMWEEIKKLHSYEKAS